MRRCGLPRLAFPAISLLLFALIAADDGPSEPARRLPGSDRPDDRPAGRGYGQVPRKTPERGFNVFDDRTCLWCKGRQRVPCPARGCVRGSQTEFEQAWIVQSSHAGTQVLSTQFARSKSCPQCRGAGVVDCPHCTDGTDPHLR